MRPERRYLPAQRELHRLGFAGAVLTDDLTALSTSSNVALTVNAVGAPTFTAPSTATVAENGSLVFSTGNGNLISFADNGSGFSSDSMTVSVNNGILLLGTTNGLIFTAGSNDSAGFTIKASVANLNAALAGMTLPADDELRWLRHAGPLRQRSNRQQDWVRQRGDHRERGWHRRSRLRLRPR